MKKSTAKIIKTAGMLLFLLYIIGLVYFMFFAEEYGRMPGERTYSYNLVLFQEIKRFIKYRDVLGPMAVLTNLVGNVVGFMPFGFILPIIHRGSRQFLWITLLTFQLSLLIEVTQLIFKVGSFDVDDLLLNTIGGMLGYLVFWICNKIRRKYIG
ncbi:VanZ family protein [Diplocloster agilis]|nr:VanZ family protein [Suonthocola fibrivorans]MCU6736492.1 VanZ family protein [Suonthocola fibrivorans]